MCSPEQAEKASNDAIKKVLFTSDANGHTRFAREVHEAVFGDGDGKESAFQYELKKAFYYSIGKWFLLGGALLILPITGLYFQVQNNTKVLNEGGYYTEQSAIETQRLQEKTDARQDAEIKLLRQETNDKFDTINFKLDQLIQRLIP